MGLTLIEGQGSDGYLGGVSSNLGAPLSAVTINNGAQIATVNGFNNEGQQAPVYAYVVEGVPTVNVSLERGVPFTNADASNINAVFAIIGGTAQFEVDIDGLEPDPTGSLSTGQNGASFSFIKTVAGQ
jgi:hypothetical protein